MGGAEDGRGNPVVTRGLRGFQASAGKESLNIFVVRLA